MKFVRRDHGRSRFSIDSLVVAAIGTDDIAYEAHYEFYKLHVRSHTDLDQFQVLEPDIENLTAAFERKMEQGYIREAFFLCQNCVRLFANRKRFFEWQDWLDRIRDQLQRRETMN